MFKQSRGLVVPRVWRLRCVKQAAMGLLIASLSLAGACQSAGKRQVGTPEGAVAIARNSWNSIYDKTHSPLYGKAETSRFEPIRQL
jgi:hypothetical protein